MAHKYEEVMEALELGIQAIKRKYAKECLQGILDIAENNLLTKEEVLGLIKKGIEIL